MKEQVVQTHWLRKDARKLLVAAYQMGLDFDSAFKALGYGARLLAHGITPRDLDNIVRGYYSYPSEPDGYWDEEIG